MSGDGQICWGINNQWKTSLKSWYHEKFQENLQVGYSALYMYLLNNEQYTIDIGTYTWIWYTFNLDEKLYPKRERKTNKKIEHSIAAFINIFKRNIKCFCKILLNFENNVQMHSYKLWYQFYCLGHIFFRITMTHTSDCLYAAIK